MVKFWVDDFSEIYKKITIIIPNSNQSYIENLNAISRFLMLLILVLLIADYTYIVVPLVLLLLIIIYYYLAKPIENFTQVYQEPQLSSYCPSNMIYSNLDNLSYNSQLVMPNNSFEEDIILDNNNVKTVDISRLYKDNGVLWTENNEDRNSLGSITYDLGNAPEFANNLFNPVPTCKEKNLNCNRYEDLRQKR